jgi:L-iditol 2-dehydrogenase
MSTQTDAYSLNEPVAIPLEMRAGVYRGKGRIGMETVPVPDIRPGEILIRVEACGICGTDVKKVRHDLVKPPQILGHEIAGTVIKTGSGVTRWAIGDRVISFHHIPCENCFYCERQLFSQCMQYKNTGVTAGFDPNGGGFSEYVRVMPHVVNRGVLRIPENVSFEEATFVEPVNTCLKAVRKARVGPGEVVFVIGQGPVGLLLSFLARFAGATVFTSDPLAFRRTMSMRFGAEDALDATADLAGEIRKRRNGIGADVVLLAVPDAKLVPLALNIARPGGRVLLFAQNDPVTQIQFPAAAVGVEEKEILGSYSAAVDCQAEAAQIVFDNHALLHELISHRFPLDDIGKAFEMASHPADDSLKLVILP